MAFDAIIESAEKSLEKLIFVDGYRECNTVIVK
jgi:hypothetical protein